MNNRRGLHNREVETRLPLKQFSDMFTRATRKTGAAAYDIAAAVINFVPYSL